MTIRLYKRVSCLSQKESGLGIMGQHDKCMAFVRDNHPDEDVVEYIDEGLSGSLSIFKRPSLSKLLSEMNQGDVLLAYDSSRIARDTMVWLNVEMTVNKAGGSIELASGVNGNTLEMQLIRRIMSQVNEYSLKKMRERTVMALKAKSDDGFILGKAPYGYVISKDRRSYIEVDGEQEVLNKIHELRTSDCKEQRKYKNIVAVINKIGYRNRSGRCWSPKMISQVYKNGSYNVKR